MDNFRKIVLAFFIINIVVVIYFGVSIKKELAYMETKYANLSQDLMNQVILQGSNISNSVAASIAEANNLIQEHSFEVSEVDYREGHATVNMKLVLKQSSKDSQVLAEFKGLESGNIESVKLNVLENLTYEAQFKLSMLENYDVQIYEQLDGSKKLLNPQAISFHLYNDNYAIRVHSIGGGTSTENERLTVHYELELANGEQDFANIDKIMLQASNHRQAIIAEYDITDNLDKNQVSFDVQAKYRTAIAAGEITNEMTIEQFQQQYGVISDAETEASYLYVDKTFTKSELGEIWDQYFNGDVYFTIQIYFNDGMTLNL